MSQGSVSTQDLLKEIDECTETHDKLLEFSKQRDTLILPDNMDPQHQFVQGITVPNPGFQQAVNTPLPPSPAVQQPLTSFQQVYQWDDESKLVIYEHRTYYMQMLTFLNEVEMNGPPSKLPSKPKTKLQHLLRKKEKAQKKTKTAEELHQYLMSQRIDVTRKINREVFFFDPTKIVNSGEAMKRLQEGYKHIQRQNAQSLFFFIQYGKLLNLCFDVFKKEKEQGIQSGTFGKWLLENIGIHESYARKLREIASLLGGYPTFECVGLSFTEIYSLKKQIKVMLDSSIQIQNFWKEELIHPFTQNLQESQQC